MTISKNRYKTIIRDGRPVKFRCPVVLAKDILTLLKKKGSMPRRQIAEQLETSLKILDVTLDELLAEGRVDRFMTKTTARNRTEIMFGVAGARANQASAFRGNETLVAFQRAARSYLMGAQA